MGSIRPLPASAHEIAALGWDRPDVIIVTGDAYVDHPAFGAAVIGRVLESKGYRVAILPQPDFRTDADFKAFPAPRLFCGITSGNLDSMVSNYSPSKFRRKKDGFSPGGIPGKRPDRAVIVYANRARSAWPGTPLVIGGIEASMRRLAHYDYWDDAVRRSVLLDSRADALVYGMGEHAATEIASRLAAGRRDLSGIAGTATVEQAPPEGCLEIDPYEKAASDKRAYARSFAAQMKESLRRKPRAIAQKHANRYVVVWPQKILTTAELDEIAGLPYSRRWHQMYDATGVPALDEVLFSVTAHRGCFGSCSFCALWAHQGRIMQSRSADSVVKEIMGFTKDERFKGIVHDIGGPTANYYASACISGTSCDGERACVWPDKCRFMSDGQDEYLKLLEKAEAVPGVRRVFVRSGLRYDYLLESAKGMRLARHIVSNNVSGHLKVAPEHISPRVLAVMRKAAGPDFDRFSKLFYGFSEECGKEQYLVSYFISGHPGATLEDALELALYLKKQLGFAPEQVQDFTPTPGTEATAMFHTGLDPLTMQPVHVAKDEEKQMQRALLQWSMPINGPLVRKALVKLGRQDLIGFGPGCLVKPARQAAPGQWQGDRTLNSHPSVKTGHKGNARSGSLGARKDDEGGKRG